MKITDVKTYILHHDLEHPFQSSNSQFNARRHCLVSVHCDDGTMGWGECLGPADITSASVHMMKPLLLGENPLNIEPLWLKLYNQFRDPGQAGVIIQAISGIDIALWDIMGKVYNTPMYQLLGGAFRSKIPAYATGGFRATTGDRMKTLCQEVQSYYDAGVRAFKIKIGFGLTTDLTSIQAVRAIIGADSTLMVDANHGYDVADAIKMARMMEPYNIAWFEEPIIPELLSGYKRIRNSQSIPVAGGETWYTKWGMHTAMSADAVDILQPDICGAGGFTDCKKIIALCDVHGVRLVPHVWGTGIAIAASLHFHAIIPPAPPAHEAREPYLEFDQTHNPFRQAILQTSIEQVNGFVNVPKGAGLGIGIDLDVIRDYSV